MEFISQCEFLCRFPFWREFEYLPLKHCLGSVSQGIALHPVHASITLELTCYVGISVIVRTLSFPAKVADKTKRHLCQLFRPSRNFHFLFFFLQ